MTKKKTMSDHYVYTTINLINGKTYTGMTSRDLSVDPYMGSGKAILEAFKKYGKENFKREIIGIYQTRDMAFVAEEIEIGEDWKLDTNYNLCRGGGGGQGCPPSGKDNCWYGKTGTDHPATRAVLGKKKSKKVCENIAKGHCQPLEIDGIKYDSKKQACRKLNIVLTNHHMLHITFPKYSA